MDCIGRTDRGRNVRVFAIATIAFALIAAHASIARGAAGYPDMRGTYSGGVCIGGTLADCEAHPQYPHTKTISTEDFTTGAVSAPGLTGQITGCTMVLHIGPDNSGYSSTETETISADGNTLTGSFSDINGHSGPDFDHRTSGGPTTCPPKRPTATSVICNYDVATGTDTCGAAVGDAGDAPSITPTGQVAFTSNFGGAFLSPTCTLTQTPASPGVASCTVQFTPPATQPVIQPGGVSARYAGDDQHAGSGGATQLLGAISTKGDDSFPSTGCGGAASSASRDISFDPHFHTDGGTKAWGFCGVLGGAGIIVGADSLGAAGTVTAAVSGPVGWFIIGGVAVIVGGGVMAHSDPPDAHYAALSLPPAAPKLKLGVRRCARGPRGGSCRLVTHRLSALYQAQLRLVPLIVAEGVAVNRQLNAIGAKDSAAVALQTAAAKVYAAQLGPVERAVQSASHSLVTVLRRTGQDKYVATASIIRDTRKVVPRLAPYMFKLLAGLRETHKEIRQQLSSLPARVSSSLKKLLPGSTRARVSQLLGLGVDVTGPTRIYRSITVANLRALVYGLTRSRTISATKASMLLTDLSCLAGRPNIARFRMDASRLVPSKYAALLRFAGVPLVGTKRCT